MRSYGMGGCLSAVIFLFVALFSGCGKVAAPAGQTAAPVSIPVKTAIVELQDFSEALEYVANIKAQEEVLVYPKVGGKVAQKLKDEGAEVSKGEPIMMVDRDEVGLVFEKAPVESPIDGILGKVYVDIGANVLPQTATALVVKMDRVKIYLDIPERYLPRVALGLSAEIFVDAYPGETFSGVVSVVSPVVDTLTRSSSVEVLVDNKDRRLRSGMFAKVRLIVQEHMDTVVVLKEAVLGKPPQQYVYIVEGGKAVLRNVRLGLRQGPYFQVTEGLKAGDRIVIIGQQRLYEGAPVYIEDGGK